MTTIYDVYDRGCSFSLQLPKEYFENYFVVTRLTTDSLTLRSGFTEYDFIRVGSGTKICGENSRSKDPLANFDALWNTFNENYPSFKLREIDWQKSREKYRLQLNSQSTDLELYRVLKEMITELKDAHVSMRIPENLKNEIQENDHYPFALRDSVLSAINAKYVDSLKSYNKGIVNWGVINQRIGYIQINAFESLANYSIDQELPAPEFWEIYRENWERAVASKSFKKDILDGVKGLMPQIIEDIKHTRSCIIDIRFNGGGFDEAGLEVLSYFTNRKSVAFSKKARFEDRFTRPQTIYVEPNTKTYPGNLFILTSCQTASAAEVFLLASQNLPNVKTIGSNTMGILSDILSKRLPNGWAYGLSNEIYESADGINYERYGIPADMDLNYDKSPEEFYRNLLLELNEKDRAIEKVIEWSAANINPGTTHDVP